jgi:DNA-directed RNA polymerase subunit H (RpoH/RPB5)
MSNSIENTNKENIYIIIENTLKMLTKRGVYDRDNIESYLADFDESKNIFEINLNNNTLCGIYLLNTPITTITSGTPIDEYLSENINIRKIIIAKSVSKKVVKQLYHEYKNIEFFFDYELKVDKYDISFIPEHKILNKEEISNFNFQSLPRLKLFDAMVRYHNGKVGDIFEITRNSTISGYSIDYKIVEYSSSDIIFNNL